MLNKNPRRPRRSLPALGARFCLLVAGGLLFSGALRADSAQGKGTDFLPEAALARRYFGNDAPWFEQNIPFFECSNPDLTGIYYYRWALYKSHLKDIGPKGYIVTEFLPDVSWAIKPVQSLNDATAFHIYEGRWLKDSRYVDDYIDFMYASGGNDRHFSESIADAAYANYLARGDTAFAVKNLESMKRIFDLWSDHYDPAKSLYFIAPISDATEFSIASIDASGGKWGLRGGNAFRPTINSFMFANAEAISRLSTLAGDTAAATEYAARAEALRQTVLRDLWNPQLAHFVDRYKANNKFVKYWDFIRGRELAGYAPWAFDLPDHDPKYVESWKYLLSPKNFAGPFGLRTVEPSYEYYMRQYIYEPLTDPKKPECQWNGPSWPFDTTLVLEGMANLLNDYSQTTVKPGDYVALLEQYARQHSLDGRPDLQEDYNPDTGAVIVGLPRSHHYNHSGFTNLIITGLAGLRPRADNTLEVNPLIPHETGAPNSIDYLCLENVPYHGHSVTILYDRHGTRYKLGAGLQVFVDGRQVVKPAALGRQVVAIPPPRVVIAPQPIDLAVNFAKKGFPAATASVNNDKADVYQAVDGRVWFWPEIRNYWTNAGTKNAEDWYGIDFGRVQKISSVRLYFYADGKQFQAPQSYRIQSWDGDAWTDIPKVDASPRQPLANGENIATFPAVNTQKFRVVFTNPAAAAIALVELKAFE